MHVSHDVEHAQLPSIFIIFYTTNQCMAYSCDTSTIHCVLCSCLCVSYSHFKMASARPTSVCDLLHHHITTGVVCDPCSGKEHHVSSVCYLVSTDTEQAPLPHNLIGSCVLIKWEQFRYTVYSGTLLIWTPEIRTPPYSEHLLWSQMLYLHVN